jgi:hypothetical protein
LAGQEKKGNTIEVSKFSVKCNSSKYLATKERSGLILHDSGNNSDNDNDKEEEDDADAIPAGPTLSESDSDDQPEAETRRPPEAPTAKYKAVRSRECRIRRNKNQMKTESRNSPGTRTCRSTR